MSSLLDHGKNDRQPPTKRKRILPEGKGTLSGSTQSRLMSPPNIGNNTVNTSVTAKICPPTDCGPIFTDVEEIDGCSSIESALGVPARILFRQVGGDRKEGNSLSNTNKHSMKFNNKAENRRRLRPLLSRQEVEQFLRLTLLAQEIDVLVDLSETVLSRRRFARRFRRDVLMQRDARATMSSDRLWKNPWLTTLGPILDVLEQRQSHPLQNSVWNQQQNPKEHILHHINNELARLYHTLLACGVYDLERSAEQNRSLVASLTDILGYHIDDLDDDGKGDDNGVGRASAVRNLAREKNSLSKLQDLLANRVRSLLIVLCHSRSTTTEENNGTSDEGPKKAGDADNGSNNQNNRKQILFDDKLASTSTDLDIETVDNGGNLPSSSRKALFDEGNDSKNKIGGDDESSVLSLEEILTPLEVVCDKLFAKSDQESIATLAANSQIKHDSGSNNCCDKLDNDKFSGCPEPTQKEKQQKVYQQKTGLYEAGKGSFMPKAAVMICATATGVISTPDSTVEDSGPMTMITAEASQRTIGAAATIMTLAAESEQNSSARKKLTTERGSSFEDSDPVAMDTAETHQRTVGAAATIMTLAGNAEQDFTAEEKLKTKQDSGLNKFVPMTLATPIASQRIAGAAATMMTLATNVGQDLTTHKTRINEHDNVNKTEDNCNNEIAIGDISNGDHPRTQQLTSEDYDSLVDDPPSDADIEYDLISNKEIATGCMGKAKSNCGILDVVDILTPQSHSQSQPQKYPQQLKEP